MVTSRKGILDNGMVRKRRKRKRQVGKRGVSWRRRRIGRWGKGRRKEEVRFFFLSMVPKTSKAKLCVEIPLGLLVR